MNLCLRLLALSLVTVIPALSADASGKWVYEISGRQGPASVTLNLRASGRRLTGSVSGGRSGETEIADGTVEGDKITFKVKRQGGPEIKYDGVVKGDRLELEITRPGDGPVKVMARRCPPDCGPA